MARIRGASSHRVRPLPSWEMAETPDASSWFRATAPGTVASALREAGAWDLSKPRDFDAGDWWFRCRFDATPSGPGRSTFLTFDGLATLADVWLNGALVLRSENMFRQHRVDVSEHLRPTNELRIRFGSVAAHAGEKSGRPRWRTRLVDDQRLRWIRTTLLGRIPGWSPPVAAVGPWRAVWLEEHVGASVLDADVSTRVDGADGVVRVIVRWRPLDGGALPPATLLVADRTGRMRVQEGGDGTLVAEGEVAVPDAALWWPHTHGASPTHPVRVTAGELEVDLGRVGFRTIVVDTTDGGFELAVNGVPVFCRGACWTTSDVATLTSTQAEYEQSLAAVRRAGLNMLRVSGATHYESDAFYETCDAQGVLVWQDLMFANLDYPTTDAAFTEGAVHEIGQLVSRTQTSPALAVLCGGSEVAQQAAMLGLPPERWSSDFFDRVIPEVARTRRPDVHYVPSSPTGGALPFHVDTGVGHYYGVGAYLRPLDDARRARVRFASECLAFSHVPDDVTIDGLLGRGQSPVHHPIWKSRVPRDSGAGWDFEDVRDQYLEELYDVRATELRRHDMARYLALSRVVTGEVLAEVLGEWRRKGSTCKGALLWFWRDLWPGAGWGIVDSTGRPKAAYWFVRRTMQPISLLAIDEGLNGLHLIGVNDTASAVDASLRLALYRDGDVCVAAAEKSVTLPPRGQIEAQGDAWLGHFADTTYAYRFGPPGHEVAVATLRSAAGGTLLAQAFHFPAGRSFGRERDLGLHARVEPAGDGFLLRASSRRFAQAVALDAPGFEPSDDYFHLEPGVERTVVLLPRRPVAPPWRLSLEPLNAQNPLTLSWSPAAPR